MLHRSYKAFSLVEIMVCLAIISILVAIVHSVYTSARHKGREATCFSNMRQMTLATNMYRQDYDGSDNGTDLPSLGLPQAFETIIWAGYVKDKSIARCPNRYIGIGKYPVNDLTPTSYNSYSVFRNFTDFPARYHEDKNFPFLSCPYDDRNYFANVWPSTDPHTYICISLDGSARKMNSKTVESRQ
jgi:prepilin-type N-terminal cleavage/methylation domain-containing protein